MGLRIKSLRLESGYSQLFIANLLGLSRSNYSQIEIGNQYPSFNSLIKIASIYSKSYDWLIHGSESRKNPFTTLVSSEIFNISQPPSAKTVLVDQNSVYISNCQSPEYLEKLSPFELPSTISRNDGVYRAFTFKTKMLKYIYPEDIIIGRAIKSYNELLPDHIYIIVTKIDILLCHIDHISLSASTLSCRNDQPICHEFRLPINDIQEIWEAAEKYSTKIQPIIDNLKETYNSFENLIQRLEKEVRSLKKLKSNN